MSIAVRPVIRLLGEPCLLGADGQRVAFRTTKVPALLAYLVARGGRPAPRTEIAEALWPGRDAGLAHQNLRQTLLYLRGCLGPAGEEALLASRRDVRLRPGVADCDVEGFRAALAEGSEGLERAATLYGGPFMDGFDDDWLLPIRAEMAHAYVRALLELSDEVLSREPGRALAYAERAIAIEPFHDGARTRKIRALRRSGEETLALREFETYESLLLEELGLRPSRTVEDALADRVPEPASGRAEPLPPAGLADAVHLLSEGDRPQDALALAISLTPYWVEVGSPAEGLRLLDEACARAGEGSFAVKAALAAAELAMRANLFDRSLGELEGLSDDGLTPEETFRSLTIRSRIHYRRREYDLARRVAIHALRFARTHGEDAADAWYLLAYAHHADDRSGRARPVALRAQREACGSRRLYGLATNLVAVIAAALGREDEARQALDESLRALAGDRSAGVVVARLIAAWHFEVFGELGQAEKGYCDAIDDLRRRNDPWLLAVGLTYVGDLKTRLGEAAKAIELHQEALRLREGKGDAIGIATSWRGLGMAHLAAGDAKAAQRDLRESIRRYAELDWDPGVASVLVSLARAEAAVGRRDVALRLARRAAGLLRGMTPATRYTISPEGGRLLPDAEALVSGLAKE